MKRAISEFTTLAGAELDVARVRAAVTEVVATALDGDVTRRALAPEDANARVARIALDFVLARKGFMLTATGPVFALSRSASDLRGLHSLANVVARACTPLP